MSMWSAPKTVEALLKYNTQHEGTARPCGSFVRLGKAFYMDFFHDAYKNIENYYQLCYSSNCT